MFPCCIKQYKSLLINLFQPGGCHVIIIFIAWASIIITFTLDEARAEYWLSSSLYYYYFHIRWGLSWILAQLEPPLLLLSHKRRLELNIGSARASIIITFTLDTWSDCWLVGAKPIMIQACLEQPRSNHFESLLPLRLGLCPMLFVLVSHNYSNFTVPC